jgi:hypothetical protein
MQYARSILKTLGAATLIGAMQAGSAQAETLEISGLYPARFAEASQTRTIRFDPLQGNGGEALQFELETSLASVDVDGQPWFDLRRSSRSVQAEATLSGSADVRISNAAYLEYRSKCIERDQDHKCVLKKEWTERCYSRTVTVNAAVELTADDGRRLYTARKPKSDYDSSCSGSYNLTSVDNSVKKLLTDIANDVRQDIAPQFRRDRIRVSEDRKAMPKDVAAQFKQAVKFTKTDADAACQLWKDIDGQWAESGPVIYNLALCAEQREQFAEAEALYARAQILRPDLKKAFSGPERIEARRQAAKFYGTRIAQK